MTIIILMTISATITAVMGVLMNRFMIAQDVAILSLGERALEVTGLMMNCVKGAGKEEKATSAEI
jgi:hypothetical protein|tara:strand:+ start:137 stop:331 length:195 start_codon:yes stop_codon:yes gene_type:complete